MKTSFLVVEVAVPVSTALHGLEYNRDPDADVEAGEGMAEVSASGAPVGGLSLEERAFSIEAVRVREVQVAVTCPVWKALQFLHHHYPVVYSSLRECFPHVR